MSLSNNLFKFSTTSTFLEDYKHYFKVAINSLRQAAGILVENYDSEKKFKAKETPADFVSELDLKVEEEIIGEIKKVFPKDGIYSEERGKIKGSTEFTWIIDPIDGTTHYLKKIPLFTVNIALQKGNETIMGLVGNPITRDYFFALKKFGAFWNGLPMRVSRTSSLKDSLIYVEFPEKKYRSQKKFKKFYESRVKELLELLEKAGGVEHHRVGAWGLCQVAKGSFDAYVDLSGSTKFFDVAPALLILEEAGGKIFDLERRSGEKIRVLATNGRLKFPFLKTV